MAQIRGYSSSAGSSTSWHPLAVIRDIVGRYLLRVSSAGEVHHYNGTAIVAPAPVVVGSTTKHVKVQNVHAINTIGVSFDGGATFFTIAAGNILEIDAEVLVPIMILASAPGTPYEILTIE